MDSLKRLAIAVTFFLSATISSTAFNDKTQPDNKIVRKADNLFAFCDYKTALPIYQKLLETNTDNAQFNYRLAVCYFYSSTDILKCIPFFEKARKKFPKNDEEAADLNYYLGTAYRMVNRFDDAIDCFSILKSQIIPDKEGSAFIKELEMEISNCNTGKTLMTKPLIVSITNLGSGINSEYPDYSPVISNDESMLLFTSKRKECTGGRVDEDGNYYEDIFICRKEKNKQWQNSVRLDTSVMTKKNLQLFNFSKSKSERAINTREHDASVAISPDGKQLYIYRLDDLWVSDLSNDSWEKPTKLNRFINARKSHEPSLSLSMDEKTLYFVSERAGGFGGKDIYYSEKQKDGSWGEPRNLGPKINTEYDEDAPFIDPGNNILYFSSEAHGSMGGFDIFRSRFENGNWTSPENMGFPINSGADDIFFVFNSTEKTGYFSSIREGGIGNFDLYRVDYKEMNEKEINALIAIKKNGKFKSDPTSIELKAGNEQNNLHLTNKSSEKISYLPGKTYSMVIFAPDSSRETIEFTVPSHLSPSDYFQEISFDEIKNQKNELVGYSTRLFNAFFDVDSAIRNTEFAKIPDKLEAYSAYFKSKQDSEIKSEITEFEIIPPATFANSDAILFAPVLFEFNKAELSSGNSPELNKVYEYLTRNKEAKVIITGYTDSKGDDLYNQKLSEVRSLKAKKYFVNKGIEDNRIIAIGKGEKDPASSNTNANGSDNPEGRKFNRRIEFELKKNTTD